MKRKTAPKSRKLTRSLSLQTLECRQVLAASVGWDGPGLGSTALTYHISGQAGNLSQAQTNAAIEKALSAWSSVANISFTPTAQAGLKNSIDISFSKIDGVGGTLAQAYFPKDVNPEPLAGNIQFDSSESWEVGNAAGSSAVDLVYVAVHEIGHALGLDHSSNLSSVMYPSVSPSQSFVSLNASDISSIQNLYGSSAGSTTGTDTTGTTGTGTTTDNDTPDTTAFPKTRWHRHGNWQHWGDRVEFAAPEHNYVLPSDVNLDNLISALDALLIINQISRGANASTSPDTGTDLLNRCDTSGDGLVTALDALRVINSLSKNQVASTPVAAPISTPNPDPTGTGATDTTGSGDTGSTDNTGGTDTTQPTDSGDNTGDGGTAAPPADTTGTDTTGTDTTGTDNTGTDNTGTDNTGTDNTGTDPTSNGDTDTPDNSGDNTDTTDDGTDTTDDDTDTTEDPTDDQDCSHPGHSSGEHGGHHLPPVATGSMVARIIGTSAEGFISRFDTSADGSLTEDELPPGLWSKLIALSADVDGNGELSLEEVDTLITSLIQTRFDQQDTNGDGELTADEVGDRFWAALGTADTDANGNVSFDEFKTWLQDKQADDSSDNTADDDHGRHKFGHFHHGHSFDLPPVPGSFAGSVGSSVSNLVSQFSSIFSIRRR